MIPFLVGSVIPAQGQAQAQQPGRSIVLILTDDMEADAVELMPSAKALIVDRGATFSRAYFNEPLCCPSRATILTGLYAQNTGVTLNSHAQFYEAGNPARTFAVWLQAAGYATGYAGKYLNGYPKPGPSSYVPPGWESWTARAGGTGLFYDYRLNVDGRRVERGSRPEDYSTDVYGRAALAFLDRALAADRPFFLQFAPSAPHSPHTPAPRHAGLFATLTAPKPPSFNEADATDKPAQISGAKALSAGAVDGVDRNYRDRARSLQSVDEVVKSIVDRLEAAGRLENTYIVLASDNGWTYGQHRVRGKGFPYEEVARMMLHVRGPGVAPGTVLEHLVGNVDLAPTFAEWAGVRAPADLDGRSLAPLLRPGAPPPEAGRHVYPMTYTNFRGGAWRGLRTRTQTYVEHSTGERELYDMAADPYQLDNRARTADATLLAKLAERTAALAACKADECRRLEDAPL